MVCATYVFICSFSSNYSLSNVGSINVVVDMTTITTTGKTYIAKQILKWYSTVVSTLYYWWLILSTAEKGQFYWCTAMPTICFKYSYL